jgi:hypothetical protein
VIVAIVSLLKKAKQENALQNFVPKGTDDNNPAIHRGGNVTIIPNADEPQPKKSLTEWNSHGKDFHEFISVRVPFREPDIFAFFAKIQL